MNSQKTNNSAPLPALARTSERDSTSPPARWTKQSKQALVATGLPEFARRFLHRVWSRTNWLLYHHTFGVVPDPCPGDSMSLQEVARTDVGLINDLAQARKLGRPGYDEKRFTRQLLQGLGNGERCFVARITGEIAGWMRLSPIDMEIWKSGVALKPGAKEFKDLFITLKYRRSGLIAYFLLVELLREAQKTGVPEVVSVISPDNSPSVRMNLRVGFKPLGTMVERRRLFHRVFIFHGGSRP